MSPGRDSYPGDMFYVHSSLLERAGRLNRNHKTLTTVPLVFTAGGDITSYLPTNIMSITDGQWILDMNIFRERMRPAVGVGVSVSRVGGRGQDARQKLLSGQVFKALTAYAEAQEFARFGSELAVQAQDDLARGERLYKVLNQAPGESYSPAAQALMLDIALTVEDHGALNVEVLKTNVAAAAAQIKSDADFDKIRDELKAKSLIDAPKQGGPSATSLAATPEAKA